MSSNSFLFLKYKAWFQSFLNSPVSHETSMQNSEAYGSAIMFYKYNSVEFDFKWKVCGAVCLEWQRQWRNLGIVSMQMGVWNSGVQSSTMNGAIPLWWAPTLTWSDSLNQDSVILKLQQQQRMRNGNDAQQQTESQYGWIWWKGVYSDIMMMMMLEDIGVMLLSKL